MNEDIDIPKNLDIDKALEEFEEKSKIDQPQSSVISKNADTPERDTSGVEFETDSYKIARFSEEPEIPGIEKLVIKWSLGVIKGQKEAEYFLFAFVLVIVGISLYFFFK